MKDVKVSKEEVANIREMLTREAILEVRAMKDCIDESFKGQLVLVIPFDTIVRVIAKIKSGVIKEYETANAAPDAGGE